ncbi:LysR family transcriptional regulator [Roseovarius sp. SCSIO 43702]|uniref:LysR family transcriptional regulator n=1 Tax=Roseovarius sp. SCSIO 43702 TaxID=2823043 RepID=UPI0021756DC5|nr:LysR substrate-binding domain-containing protein [Roseovarius sp. SCSIO 43702]
MTPELQLAQLRTLIAIDEEGSFSAAAERLGRTQSAVTQQMQALEHVVGTPLFVSRGRRRELTEAGQTLLRHSHEIVSLCKQAMTASGRSQTSGVVRLGAPLEIANDLLPDVLREFAARRPDVRVVLLVERSRRLMRMLEEGALDITLSTWRAGSSDGRRVKLLPVHWIAAEGWTLEPGAPLPLVLTDAPSMFRRLALAALDAGGWAYLEKFTSHSTAGIRFGVKAGIGITARTQSAFRGGVQMLGTDLGLPALPRVSYYLHRALGETSEAAEDLYRMIATRAGDDDGVEAEPDRRS